MRACIINSAGLIIRSRFHYTAGGVMYECAWVTSALGGQNCVTLQGLTALRLDVEKSDFTWKHQCRRDVLPNRNVTLTVNGTGFSADCNVQQ